MVSASKNVTLSDSGLSTCMLSYSSPRGRRSSELKVSSILLVRVLLVRYSCEPPSRFTCSILVGDTQTEAMEADRAKRLTSRSGKDLFSLIASIRRVSQDNEKQIGEIFWRVARKGPIIMPFKLSNTEDPRKSSMASGANDLRTAPVHPIGQSLSSAPAS